MSFSNLSEIVSKNQGTFNKKIFKKKKKKQVKPVTTELPIKRAAIDVLSDNRPFPKCPKCYSTTVERTIWENFKAKKIIQCKVCKFYWML